MPASLVRSQFATLEPLQPDENGLVIDLDQPLDAIVKAYLLAVGPVESAASDGPAVDVDNEKIEALLADDDVDRYGGR